MYVCYVCICVSAFVDICAFEIIMCTFCYYVCISACACVVYVTVCVCVSMSLRALVFVCHSVHLC